MAVKANVWSWGVMVVALLAGHRSAAQTEPESEPIVPPAVEGAMEPIKPPPVTEPEAAPPVPAAEASVIPVEQSIAAEEPKDERLFGSFKLRLAVAQPKFDEDNPKFYKDLYREPAGYPTLAVDSFFFDWYATFGVGMRASYYYDRGKTAESYTTDAAGKPVGVVKNDKELSELTVLPLQLLVTFQFTPFWGKWVVVDGWMGYEKAFFQETRSGSAEEAAATPTSSLLAAEATASSTEKQLANSGWKDAIVTGAAFNILLNPLDEPSVYSLESTLGFNAVYLSPYVEIVKNVSKKGIGFSRQVVGVAFTFESRL